MNIVGFIPNSFVDYPQNISAVIFIGGCNFDCTYCHNRWTIDAKGEGDLCDILQRIEKNSSFLDAVTISGGEPTLQKVEQLEQLIAKIKAMGLKVKLDTNGSRAEVVKRLLPTLDYIAMDVKAPLDKYSLITPISKQSVANMRQSIQLIKESAKDYEFRTTFAPELSIGDIAEIAQTIKGAKRYFIQKYSLVEGCKGKPHNKGDALQALQVASAWVPTCLRGY